MLECEDCWDEVRFGRAGRAVAESARELAPQSLREMVRSSVAAAEAPGRKWQWWVPTLAVPLIMALVAVTFVLDGGQPREIDLALADFRGETSLGPEAESRLPAKVGDLDLVETRAGRVGDLDVTAHTYEDQNGHVLVVYLSDETWPVADGADHASRGDDWSAEIEGAVFYCTDNPHPSLVIGESESDVDAAAETLGLR
jgi:hypothetical protein